MRVISTKNLRLDRDEIQIAIADYCKQKGYDVKPEEITFVVSLTNEKYPRKELQFCSVAYENYEEEK